MYIIHNLILKNVLDSVMPWSTRDLDHSIWHQLYVDSLKTEMKSQPYSRYSTFYLAPALPGLLEDWDEVPALFQVQNMSVHGAL